MDDDIEEVEFHIPDPSSHKAVSLLRKEIQCLERMLKPEGASPDDDAHVRLESETDVIDMCLTGIAACVSVLYCRDLGSYKFQYYFMLDGSVFVRDLEDGFVFHPLAGKWIGGFSHLLALLQMLASEHDTPGSMAKFIDAVRESIH